MFVCHPMDFFHQEISELRTILDSISVPGLPTCPFFLHSAGTYSYRRFWRETQKCRIHTYRMDTTFRHQQYDRLFPLY